MHLDLESLACVDALARTLSFHRAARACALSPAAFGKRVKQVEEDLGRALFHRTTRRVELTPEGVRTEIPEGTALVPWDEVVEVEDTAESVDLWTDDDGIIAVPARAFDPPEQREEYLAARKDRD